jgi:orotidine-5'-phosphate decarboxylase
MVFSPSFRERTMDRGIRRVLCALDTTDLAWAKDMAVRLAPRLGGVKLGLEFYGAHGPRGVAEVVATGVPVFLDLKLHDIPNTVAGAVRAVIAQCRPAMLNVHASGGAAMMTAAAEAAADAAAIAGTRKPALLAVTVLTSLDDRDLDAVGQRGPALDQVRRLAALTQACGLDGVVCSAAEVAALRQDLGPDFLLVVPGIRPVWSGSDDQKRMMTPVEAVNAGASHLVIGRPITRAPDPADAVRRIADELAAA